MKKILNLLLSLFISKRVLNDRIVYKNRLGQYHRTDGPAVEHNNGNKWWYINGQIHRTDGPAIEYNDGTKSWVINGKKHREDGPAIEWSDGYKMWYLNDIRYSEEKYQHELIKIKLKRLIRL
jgi:hypothetical protein